MSWLDPNSGNAEERISNAVSCLELVVIAVVGAIIVGLIMLIRPFV
jgi:hypothetical protein